MHSFQAMNLFAKLEAVSTGLVSPIQSIAYENCSMS
jgi:hypothetical protein